MPDPAANGSCIDYNDMLHDLATSTVVKTAFGIAYTCIVSLALLGNLCVILAITTNPHLRASVRNVFIVSLSFSDACISLTSGVITPTTAFAKQWYFGHALCLIVPMVQGMSVFISTFTLAMIAIDRAIIVCGHSSRLRPLSMAHAHAAIACIWCAAAFLSTPPLLYQRFGPIRPYCGVFCREELWPLPSLQKTYGLTVLALQFVLPLSVIGLCYAAIFRKMSQGAMARQRMQQHQQQQQHKQRQRTSSESIPPMQPSTVISNERRQQAARRQRRTTFMLIAMVVAFACSWFPQVLYMLLRDLNRLPPFIRREQFLFGLLTHCLSMTSTIWNPILYVWLNESLKQAVWHLLPAGCAQRLGLHVATDKRPTTGKSVTCRQLASEPADTVIFNHSKQLSVASPTGQPKLPISSPPTLFFNGNIGGRTDNKVYHQQQQQQQQPTGKHSLSDETGKSQTTDTTVVLSPSGHSALGQTGPGPDDLGTDQMDQTEPRADRLALMDGNVRIGTLILTRDFVYL